MKKIKKPVSILLSVLLIVSLFTIAPFTAGAAGNTKTASATFNGINYSDTIQPFFTVTWQDDDGTVLRTDTNVPYGTSPDYGDDTVRESTFTGWTPDPSPVNGDVTYTAQYTKAIDPAHFSQDGDTYSIHDAAGWEIFCDLLAENPRGYFDGKTVMLGDDIAVTRMAGGAGHDMTGTFDGQGHTLTVSYGSADAPVNDDDKAAPFRNVESGCVIKNLHTAGTIYTSKKYAGGIVGTQYGTVRIENCRSSVTINSLTSGDGTHGGIVGRIGNSTSAELTITGCLFDGKLLTVGNEETTSCSGFVGYKFNQTTLTITNSIYVPTALEPGETEAANNSVTFVRNGSAGSNCYYTRALGATENQGKQAYTVTAGENVTLALSGTATEYTVSGITAYADNCGLKYGDKIYAGNEDELDLTLGYTRPAGYAFTGYTVSAGTLADNVLNMTAEDVTINAGFEQATYTITVAPTTHGTVLSIKSAAVYGEYVALIIMPESGYYAKSVYINGNVLEQEGGGYSFDMPDENVTVTAEFAKKPVSVTYLDQNGSEKTVQAVPLDNTMTSLESGWYVVNSDIVYTAPIFFDGTVNLILADGCTMSVGTEEAPITSSHALRTNYANAFTIYGQSNGSGTLQAYASAKSAFYATVGNYVQNGGNAIFRTTGSSADAVIVSRFTLNGGTFNASTTGSDSHALASALSIAINGGKFTASCQYSDSTQASYGLYSNGIITLSYRSAEDSIQVSSIRIVHNAVLSSYVAIANRKTFTDGTNVYDKNTSTETLEALRDVTLTPANAFDITVSECVNGAVTAPGKMLSGASVTLNVTPDEGYAVTGVQYNNTEIEAVNGVYAFVMPNENVTVTASFGLIGDANRDGRINVKDVTALQRHLADLSLIPEAFLVLADTDGDGDVDITDVTHLQRYLAEYEVMLGQQAAAAV